LATGREGKVIPGFFCFLSKNLFLTILGKRKMAIKGGGKGESRSHLEGRLELSQRPRWPSGLNRGEDESIFSQKSVRLKT